MKKFLIPILAVFTATAVGWVLHHQYSNAAAQHESITAILVPTVPTPAVSATVNSVAADVPPLVTTIIPSQMQLSVPYTLQAPYNKWDALHEDACEETSLIMIKHYLNHTPISSPAQADHEIIDLLTWEQQHGYGPSISLAQLNQIAKDDYGMNTGSVVQINSIDQVKQEIANTHPVIVGLAGKLLPNPYFSHGGPNYHMLVMTGYDNAGVITNEPGTWHGDGFHYNYQDFYSAIHDWNSTNILNGQKAYLVFK